MNRKPALLLLFCLLLILAFLSYPKSTFAEIATVKDWIGLFPKSADSDCGYVANVTECRNKTIPINRDPNKTPDGHSWVYTSSCAQNPGTIPYLANPIDPNYGTGCIFNLQYTIPPNGDYEFRLYANDQATTDALLAIKIITVGSAPPIVPPPPVTVTGKIYNFTGDLTINTNITVAVAGVIFVDGELTINTNLTHTSNNAGLVFVVKGDVNINPAVTEIDAVIISSGKIYTAGEGCTKNLINVGTDALVINGSLISLDQGAIVFCRTLTDNTEAAEEINEQPKYLVILRDLFSDTLQKWSEVSAGGSAIPANCSSYNGIPVNCASAGCSYIYSGPRAETCE